MTAPTQAPENVPAKTSEIEYVVLALTEGGWKVQRNVFARTPENAIKQTFKEGNGQSYVAVPSRSWKPVKVTPKVETTLTFEAAR